MSRIYCVIAEYLYLAFFAVMITVKMAGFYEGQFVFNAALVFSAVLLVIKVVLDKYTFREYVMAALFILLGGIVYLNTGEKGLLICFAMMLGMKGVSVKKVFVCGAICSGIVLLIKILGVTLGVLPEKYYASYREGMGIELRHSLGYVHPNTVQISTLIFGMMALYLISKYTSHILIGSLMVLSINVFVFQLTGSRTGMMVCIIYICVNIWFYYIKRLRILEKVLCFCSYPMACCISLLAPLLFEHGNLISRLDAPLFSYRLSITKYYYENNTISLFGIRLNNPDANVFSLDMAYVYLLLQLGLMSFIVISCLTLLCVYQAVHNNMSAELALFVGITIAGIWEPFLYNSSFKNVLFVFAGAVLFRQINSCDERRISFSKRQIMAGTITVAVVGVLALGIYLFQTTEPTSIYVNADPPEIVKDEGIEPIYLTENGKDAIVERGGLVLGYEDEKTPLYEYGVKMAHDEYRNRCLSMAMLGGLLGIVGYGIWNRYSRS